MLNKRKPPHALPEEGLVRLHHVLSVIPISRSSWLAGVKEGRFPQPVHVGARTVAWRIHDIRALFKAQSHP